jgi:SAM-dependent methyltransferase
MRKDATQLEETRLDGVEKIEDYPSMRERHRVFPQIFEDRRHKRILDIAAGVGCAARRIKDAYPATMVCNDITSTCLNVLKKQGLAVLSFDIDDDLAAFPFASGQFDAVVSLATIEHVICLDHHLQEIHRILEEKGYLYISSPNYAGLVYLPRFVWNGQSFHDPLNESSRYEFYAHVRYFTYHTLLAFVSSFGFTPLAVYLPLPGGSSFYRSLHQKSPTKAQAFRYSMWMIYKFGSPRWASEPVICFQKNGNPSAQRFKKVVV